VWQGGLFLVGRIGEINFRIPVSRFAASKIRILKMSLRASFGSFLSTNIQGASARVVLGAESCTSVRFTNPMPVSWNLCIAGPALAPSLAPRSQFRLPLVLRPVSAPMMHTVCSQPKNDLFLGRNWPLTHL
jgi:hypothetical protein